MGWRYRLVNLGGVLLLTALAFSLATSPPVQVIDTTYRSFLNGSSFLRPGQTDTIALVSAVAVVVGSFLTLSDPQTDRRLDTVVHTETRVLRAAVLLATLGYFNWVSVPQTTLVMATGLLLIVLPVWLAVVRARPVERRDRALVIGTDAAQIERMIAAADVPVVGYLSPASVERTTASRSMAIADGGITRPSVGRLGGLSRIDAALDEHGIDTVLLALPETDRGEFFGTLTLCRERGVRVKTFADHGVDVFVSDEDEDDELIVVDLDPWNMQDHVVKRLFDVAFAAVGLVLLAPVFVLIAIAVKLDSPGPVFYVQERTAVFGETFAVPKFRTMRRDSEATDLGSDEENGRITRAGRLLRESNLDELPQLLSILTGRMSAVGPRAIWIDEERRFEAAIPGWKCRWFVKPGLTGLAQIHDASSREPRRKLDYDLEYIDSQSARLDVAIVLQQVRLVVTRVRSLLIEGSESR
ncbi:sugar transferase [Halalkalicoccus subterraneus]|uniref:sugar transferase n=1 Tax=Halalkalicoccus subterraneus TaxID=2675002 RepID=UPI000EFA5DB2|nr:sugar transferase [Halalkalicoccus subterraneus]